MSYSISNIVQNYPVGCISMYLGTTDPSGWILCDGIARDNTSGIYNNLAIIGGTLSSNNSLYTPPNLQGYFLLGSDNTQTTKTTGGSNSVKLNNNQIPTLSITNTISGTHTHALGRSDIHNHVLGVPLSTANGSQAQIYDYAQTRTTDTAYYSDSVTTGITVSGANAGMNTTMVSSSYTNSSQTSIYLMPSYYTVNYIIKY